MKNFIKQVNEYYPEYLKAHKHPANKALHVVGNLFLIFSSAFMISFAAGNGLTAFDLFFLALWLPLHWTYTIYLFAWPGHLFIEKNKPATWKVSRWITKACDWKMMFELITGNLKWDTRKKIRPEMIKMATEKEPRWRLAHAEKVGEYDKHSGTKGIVTWHEKK